MDEMNGTNEKSAIITGKVDPATGDIAVQLVRMVAMATDKAVTDLDPLYWSVDGDALETLLDVASPVAVSFEYAGHSVVIQSDKTVKIYLIEDD